MSDTIDPMITEEQDAKPEGRATAGGDVPGPRLDRAGQQRLAEQLVEQAREQGLDLAGADGLLAQLTKRVLETALEAEMVEHLGYEAHQGEGRNGGNSRNGRRSKTGPDRCRAGGDRGPPGPGRFL